MRLLIATVLALSTNAFALNIAGSAKGEIFGFSVNTTKITGNWGDKVYSVEIYRDEWKGSIGGKEFSVQFWNPDITGNLPCGEVKIGSWSTEVEGVICGDSFVTTTGEQRTSNQVSFDAIVSAFLAEFPIPVQGMIRSELDWFHPTDSKK